MVDDGRPSVADLCAGLDRVRYVRLKHTATTGAKLNIGIRHAHGVILQKWDDDDYYHPDFLRLALSHLPRRESERTIVAWCCFLALFPGETCLHHSGHGLQVGGTLCFYRRLWQRRPFRDISLGQDMWFLRDHKPRIVRVCAPEYYIVLRHGRNTWTRIDEDWSTDEYYRSQPVYRKRLGELVHPRDLSFYRSLRWGKSPITAD